MGFADTAFRAFMQGHVNFYKATGGRFAGKRLLLLTTTGRKTGKLRVSPLMRIEDGDNYLVAASVGGAPRNPGWFHNLQENPLVQVQVGHTIENRRARITRGEERDRLWQKFVEARRQFADYQERTERTIPVVVLEPTHNPPA
ncbi:MAG: nitroreductase family deazaflavin-dependent oxidoreductase [Acidimicrobiia bacterium]|nr:nitroreductase family deazaflavin-dependent oxidoreductase [Acidimicrobiia bacterium]